MKIVLINSFHVQTINKKISNENHTEYRCYGVGKIESALHSAFYPGDYPFQHGGIAKVAGALAFYILKAHAFFDGNKRTALLSSAAFLALNGLSLRYPKPKSGWSEFAVVLNKAAEGEMSLDDLKEWYESHKVPII